MNELVTEMVEDEEWVAETEVSDSDHEGIDKQKTSRKCSGGFL